MSDPASTRLTKSERSWILYDVANSAFTLIITTALFSLFYQLLVSPERYVQTWAYTNSIASLVVAFLAPILGTVADFRGFKKPLFAGFFVMGVIATFAMFFLRGSAWYVAMGVYALGSIGFSGANVFYDSFLTDVTTEDRMHRISSSGFAWGYIGSVIPFLGAIALVQFWEGIGLPSQEAGFRVAFLLTATWWAVFTIPILRNVQQVYYIERTPNPIRATFRRLGQTFARIRTQHRAVFVFLGAYFFYIEGVNAIIRNATPIAVDMGFGQTLLIVVLLVLQIVAWPFAIVYGRLAKRFGARAMIFTGIFTYVGVVILAFFLPVMPMGLATAMFWVLAMLIASAQGGIQALSRSYLGRMIPEQASAEFFGFYNIVGKFSSFVGSFMIAFTTQLTGQSRYGILSILLLFLIGGLLLTRTSEEEARKEEGKV